MKQRSTIKRILVFVKPHIGYLIVALLSAVLSVSAMLYIPILTGEAIDAMADFLRGKIGSDMMFQTIVQKMIWVGGSVMIYALFQWIMNVATTTVAHKTIQDIRIFAFDKLQQVPLRYIDKTAHGDIMARMIPDVELISIGLLQGFTQLFTGIVTVLITIIIMVVVNWILALVVVLITPLSLFIASFIAKGSYKMFQAKAKTEGTMSGIVEEMVGNQKIIKSLGYEKRSIAKYQLANEALKYWGFRSQIYTAFVNPCTRFVNGIVYAAVGIVGAILVVNDVKMEVLVPFTVGMLSAFLSYAQQYTKPFNEISGVVNELQSARSAAVRIFEIIDEMPEPSDQGLPALAQTNGNVILEDVHFSYVENQHLFENFNLKVQPGQRIAIVGPTGCGKTTLINLLMRFYDVNSGAILVDEQNIQTVTRKSLRQNFGMVLQDTWIFKGTIRDNIAYGKPEATLDEVISAAKAAHIHGFIKRLFDGYQTIISDNHALSEGQRQLLCIARVMLTKPPMLILDEATSNIDTLTEIRIQKAFQEMMKGRTSFVIAHRLATIIHSDWILVMNHGNVIEQGTHDSLLKQQGFYATLYNSQFEKGIMKDE